MLRFGVVIVLVCAGLGCADEGPPSVAGKSAEAQSEIAADVACDYVARCGVVSVVCSDCDGEDCGGCTVEVEEVTHEDCVADLQPDYEAQFGCAPLTETEVDLVDTCLAKLAELPCQDLEQLEAWANGEPFDDSLVAIPTECVAAEDIGESCEDDQAPGGDEGRMPDPE